MSQYRVLVADDDESIRGLLQKVIETMGWEAVDVPDGHEALQRIEQDSFPIAILDVKMPGPSGNELARLILQKEAAPAIIILTGYAELSQAVQAVKEGVFDYVQKETIGPSELRALLRRAAKYHESRRQSLQAHQEREKHLQNIEAANHQFRMAFELTRDLIFMIDAKTFQILDCNLTACQTLQYSREELLQKTFDAVMLEWDHERANQWLFASPQSETPQEMRIRRKDQTSFSVEAVFGYMGFQSGEILSVAARDITRRKEMQAKLEKERTLLQTIMDNIPDHVYIKDTEHRFVRVNKTFAKRYGLASPEEAIGKTLADFPNIQHQQNVEATEQRLFETHRPIINELRVTQYHDAQPGYYLATKVPLVDSAGQLQGVVGITRDITELHQAKTQIETQARELHTIIESLQEGVLLCDTQNRVVEVNPWYARLLGKPRDFLIGESLESTLASPLGCRVQPYIQAFQFGTSQETEMLSVQHHGRDLRINLHPIIHTGDYQGLVITVEDVSDLLSQSSRVMQESELKSKQTEALKSEMHSSVQTIHSLIQQTLTNEMSAEVKDLLDVANAYCEGTKAMIEAEGEEGESEKVN